MYTLHILEEYSVYTFAVVLVELTQKNTMGFEENGAIVSRISYNQSLANNITINFYPMTYDHYLEMPGLHLPDDILPLESKQVSFIILCFV